MSLASTHTNHHHKPILCQYCMDIVITFNFLNIRLMVSANRHQNSEKHTQPHIQSLFDIQFIE